MNALGDTRIHTQRIKSASTARSHIDHPNPTRPGLNSFPGQVTFRIGGLWPRRRGQDRRKQRLTRQSSNAGKQSERLGLATSAICAATPPVAASSRWNSATTRACPRTSSGTETSNPDSLGGAARVSRTALGRCRRGVRTRTGVTARRALRCLHTVRLVCRYGPPNGWNSVAITRQALCLAWRDHIRTQEPISSPRSVQCGCHVRRAGALHVSMILDGRPSVSVAQPVFTWRESLPCQGYHLARRATNHGGAGAWRCCSGVRGHAGALRVPFADLHRIGSL